MENDKSLKSSCEIDIHPYFTAEGAVLTNAGGGPFAFWAWTILKYSF